MGKTHMHGDKHKKKKMSPGVRERKKEGRGKRETTDPTQRKRKKKKLYVINIPNTWRKGKQDDLDFREKGEEEGQQAAQ